ncbi:mala s 12 allergen [Ephemerocybe angulata]|uniref:pyranose dehydrogenase (acceptor) n=1 Tax=Ephemerocybe angulata TaxID=980116 RepID=A0A8H6IAH4_9AGAR|nr:mala s 12 allergen [Tulosesus angulatus]
MRSILRSVGFITIATTLATVSATPSPLHLELAARYEENIFPRLPTSSTSTTISSLGVVLAGLVLASRLSEDSSRRVLVLEAGLQRRCDAPAGAYYESIKQPMLNNRGIYWPRGKILGGSTAMNAMYLVRPSQIDVDSWQSLLESAQGHRQERELHRPRGGAMGNRGRFPYDAANHGSGGPYEPELPARSCSASSAIGPSALATAGISTLQNPNGGVTMGGFISPSSINPYEQDAFLLAPRIYRLVCPPRSNLHILPEATVTKIGFTDKLRSSTNEIIAHSVEFAKDSASTRYVVGVNREVILAGGPLGSPKILMHSGVGPTDVLQQIGLDVVYELPGVGQHLQDHLTAGVAWESRVETAGDVRASNSDFSKSSEFLSFINDAVAFVNASLLFNGNDAVYGTEIANMLANGTTTVPSTSPEVIEGYKAVYNLTVQKLWPGSAQIEMLMSVISPGSISIQSALQHPYSRGRVYINSTNPFDPIVIDPQYFSHPADRTIMRQGVKLVRLVGAALGDRTDDQIDAWLTNSGANTQYHPASACAMLPRKWGGVVDSDLKVYGLANVRVIDSSVYPFEFAAHLASATYGLAEIGSGIVKESTFEVPSGAKVDEKELGRQGKNGLLAGV